MADSDWYAGHRKGYMDAVTQIWEMAHEAYSGDAFDLAKQLNQIGENLRRQYSKAHEQSGHLRSGRSRTGRSRSPPGPDNRKAPR